MDFSFNQAFADSLYPDNANRFGLAHSILVPQDQMEKKTTRRCQLQDLLHVANLKGVTMNHYGERDGSVIQARFDPHPTV